jgi:Spy/CpxP family protein refolding chaperone
MTEWLSARTRPKLVAFSLLFVTFVVGGLSGAALNSAASARELPADKAPAVERPVHDERGPHGARGSNGGSERERSRRRAWLDDIGATEEQRAQIDAILEERRRQMDAVIKEQEPRMQAIIAASNAEVMNVLTPEQREKMEQRRAEMRARRAADAANQQNPEKQ